LRFNDAKKYFRLRLLQMPRARKKARGCFFALRGWIGRILLFDRSDRADQRTDQVDQADQADQADPAV
jgi:hypothetical protein